MTFEGCCGGGFVWLRARERRELGAGAQSRRAHAMSRESVGGEEGGVCVYVCMQWV
jgi:hypothetical protein